MGRQRIILGSASTARRGILAGLGYDVVVRVSSANEDSVPNTGNPADVVTQKTRLKTDQLLQSMTTAEKDALCQSTVGILVCGDLMCQWVASEGEGGLFGKPKDIQEAVDWILKYQKQGVIATIQALELTDLKTGRRVCGTDKAVVHFSDPELSEEEVRSFLEENLFVLKAAGALIIENHFFQPWVKSVDGEPESVMGLSPRLFKTLLSALEA